MAGLDEIASILFNQNEDTEAPASALSSTTIIYGTALADSEDGEVLVLLDDAIYSLDDDAEEYETLSLSVDDDSMDNLDEDIEEEIEDEEAEIVY